MISPLEMTLFLLLASVAGVVVFRFLNLPPMLGYLTVGIIVGPHAFGLVPDSQGAQNLAEFGVVFLMFSIGLEFSLSKLRSMRRLVFGLGLLQVIGTVVVAVGLGFVLERWVHITWQGSVALGGALAMSSTAIVSKMLAERLEIETEHGRNIFGVLLFQDLAVVPLLIIISALGGDSRSLMTALGLAAVKIVVALALLLIVGQKFMTRWFNVVARRRSQELFILNLLLVTLGAAFITDKFGLSLALGAFIAGMLIAETPYRHQVEEDIKPFRDVLLGLFFVTTGMLLNPVVIWKHPFIVLAFLIGPMLLKLIMVTALSRLFGASPGVAMRTGIGLAQAGEFGFVLLNLILDKHLVDATFLQAILAAMLLSMLAAPFLIQNADRIVLRLSSTEWNDAVLADDADRYPKPEAKRPYDHLRIWAGRAESCTHALTRRALLCRARPRPGPGGGGCGGGRVRGVRRRRAARVAAGGRDSPGGGGGDHVCQYAVGVAGAAQHPRTRADAACDCAHGG